jgi:hypothetical protein
MPQRIRAGRDKIEVAVVRITEEGFNEATQ